MRRWAVVLSAVTISLGAATTVAGTAANASNDNDPYTVSDGHAQAGGMYGVVPANDSNAGRPGGGGSGGGGAKLLSYHGGPVVTGASGATAVQAIFWGQSWAKYVGDKMTGIDSEYGGLVGPSHYSNTTTEYTDGGGVHVSPLISYTNHVTDTSALTFSGAPTTNQIAQEVVNAIGASNIAAGGYYPVYVDEPRGSAGYCAWHSNGSTAGKEFQIGFFFNLNNDPGCDPDQVADSDGLRALANVTGHEFSEMVTDPLGSAWYDQRGQENADKCAWTFGGNEQLSNGSTWYIQGNWSNAAYNANQGYTYKGTFYRGCIISSN